MYAVLLGLVGIDEDMRTVNASFPGLLLVHVPNADGVATVDFRMALDKVVERPREPPAVHAATLLQVVGDRWCKGRLGGGATPVSNVSRV